MNEEEKYQTEYNEINLKDYIRVIVKNRKIIFAFLIIALIGVYLFNYFSPKIYSLSSYLEIGKIGGSLIQPSSEIKARIENDISYLEIGKIGGSLIQPSSEIKARIEQDIYQDLARERLGISEKVFSEIEVTDLDKANLVLIRGESTKPDKAKRVLEEINNIILVNHQEKLARRKKKVEESIKEFQEELEFLETQKQYSEGIAPLQIRIVDSKKSINNYQPTKIIKEPEVSENPINSGLMFDMFIAGALGIVVGVFAAFGKNWLEINR